MRLIPAGFFRWRGPDGGGAGPVLWRSGFTLIELLVVLAIIGLVMALSLPHFRHMSEGRVMEGAAQQLLHDLAFARQSAIASRGTVAVVFVPSDILNPSFVNPFASSYDAQEKTNLLTLQGGALTSYALFGYRQIGEQPGGAMPRYLTPWHSLPDKTFISKATFNTDPPWGFHWATNVPIPFPLARSQRTVLPYVAFNGEGQCLPVKDANGSTDNNTGNKDIYISLASGTILYTRDPVSGAVQNWTAQEIPPSNSVNTASNVIHIDWLTGRAKLERAEVTK